VALIPKREAAVSKDEAAHGGLISPVVHRRRAASSRAAAAWNRAATKLREAVSNAGAFD
jgi:hypothetical protein